MNKELNSMESRNREKKDKQEIFESTQEREQGNHRQNNLDVEKPGFLLQKERGRKSIIIYFMISYMTNFSLSLSFCSSFF